MKLRNHNFAQLQYIWLQILTLRDNNVLLQYKWMLSKNWNMTHKNCLLFFQKTTLPYKAFNTLIIKWLGVIEFWDGCTLQQILFGFFVSFFLLLYSLCLPPYEVHQDLPRPLNFPPHSPLPPLYNVLYSK